MAFKTPGVYIQEISTFPPSVVPVETAVPAFIGYTQMAVDEDSNAVAAGTVVEVTSMLDFEMRFGGAYRPRRYAVQIDTANDNAIGTVTPLAADLVTERRYYLYDSMRLFYANGGGPCFVVSVGSYSSAPAVADFQQGLAALERVDRPTILTFPDAVSLPATDLGSLQQAAIAQCQKLGDRVAVMDLRDGDLRASITLDPVEVFRQQIGTNNLRYGAAYYPWLHTIYRPTVGFSELLLVAMDDTVLSDATLDSLLGPPNTDLDALVPAARSADAVVTTIVDAVTAGLGGVPDLTIDDFADMSGHFAALLQALRDVDVADDAAARDAFADLLRLPRALALALQAIDAEGLTGSLGQQVTRVREDDDVIDAIAELIALEKNADVLGTVSDPAATEGDVDTAYASLDVTEWLGGGTVAGIVAEASDFTASTVRATALTAAGAFQSSFDTLAAAVISIFDAARSLAQLAENALFDRHPVFRDVKSAIERTMTVIPTAGAICGVYASVDRTRGVWKAPANHSLADVSGPSVKLDNADQENLNVHTTGKSVNAIRTFAGKGTLIWGARTLAGNDNEWRYISTRRVFNMTEESIKKATERFVFEPNDANTWMRVKAMIDNFLTILWRQGALAGASPAQAFYTRVGLGTTMTAQDILEGRMIVEIGMAVVRPAEFIILKFSHKMQVS
jgi:phage tail sheath protein FI